MSDLKNAFITFLIANGALRFGDFVLKSGDHSPFFIDLGRVRTGRGLDQLGEVLARALFAAFPDANVLFGPAYKGIALATAAAAAAWRVRQRDLHVFFDRKEGKAHGERGRFIGHEPEARDRIVVVDDVLSSGGTKVMAIQAIEEAFHVKPIGVLVTVDRARKTADVDRQALNLYSIIDIGDLWKYLDAQQDQRAEAVRAFWEGRA